MQEFVVEKQTLNQVKGVETEGSCKLNPHSMQKPNTRQSYQLSPFELLKQNTIDWVAQ